MMRAAMIFALWLVHASVALISPQEIFTRIERYKNNNVNLTQFMNTSYIWTVEVGTRNPANRSSIICTVDHPECVTIREIVFLSNFTRRGVRHSEEVRGQFLDPEKGPTSMLLMDPVYNTYVRLDVLAYSSPNKTCGVFYSMWWTSPELRERINKSYPLTEINNTQYIQQNFGNQIHTIQCQKRVRGNSTTPNKTTDCDGEYKNICSSFTPRPTYFSSCPDPPPNWYPPTTVKS